MVISFPLEPLSHFESRQTSIRRPKHFLQFSFNDKHEVQVGSDESLCFYYPPYIPAPGTSIPRINLSNGFDSWVKSDENNDGHLDALLATIQAHEEALLEQGMLVADAKTQADVITWRGMMTKIMTVPFDDYSDFEMNATWYQGSIYIEENHAYNLEREKREQQETLQRKQGRPPRFPQEVMQYWGYKFESLSTLPKPWAECTRKEIDHRDLSVVNNNAQYCSIVRTGIGNASLIIAGEVDCVMGEKPFNPNDPTPWIELKTSREPGQHPRQQEQFERKLCKFWAQSFLLGVPTIIVGFRDDDGYLTHIKELQTQRIPGDVARKMATWNGNLCINLTDAFLNFLKTMIGKTQGVWRIKHSKNSPVITLTQVEKTGTGSIISQAFKQHRERLLAMEVAKKLASKPAKDD